MNAKAPVGSPTRTAARTATSPDPRAEEYLSNRSTLHFEEQLRRAADFFRGRNTLEGVVARRVLRVPSHEDEDLADHLIRERRRKSRMDGSLNGSLVLTARATWELLELGAPNDHAGVVRFTGYLLEQQDLPGRWSDDGQAGNGFFSPGPRSEPIAPLVLPSGTVFTEEDDARFVASCLALRAVLRAGHDRRAAVRAHLDGLLAIRAIDSHLAFVALGALGMAPPPFLDRIGPLVEEVGRRQADDGSWGDVTIFHAVDMLLSLPTAQARAVVRKAAPLIAALQTDSGAFDETESESIALIALRALDASRAAA